MKYGNRVVSTLIKLIFGCICGMVTGVWFLVALLEKNDPVLILVLLAAVAFWWLGAFAIWNELAPGELTPEGVYVRGMFRKRFYPWSSIRQAGVLWCQGRGIQYNEIVLLKSSGSPRRYRDRWFLLRNPFKVIHIPCKEEIKQYIIKHYGPLDFDLSDGRSEQSVVVD